MTWFTAVVLLVAGERLAELVVARRHAAWAFGCGGREHAPGHYRVMVLVHTGLLVGCLIEVPVASRPFLPPLGWSMLVLVVAAQALRWWCIRTLGRQWNTRIIVVPGLGRVTAGPYRVLDHPNYVAVVVEGVALPLVHTAWLTAAVFAVLNAGVLAVRLRAENQALRQLA